MDPHAIIKRLAHLTPAIDALAADISDADARWKPATGAWSILEIVCHLIDEELEDFGPRLRSTLEDPSRAWPPIDPEGWAIDRRYNERSLVDQLARLRRARTETLQWLGLLASSDWSCTHFHPKLGPIRAGDLLAAWAAHDLLHLRQLTKRKYELVDRDAAPYGARYAGSWTA